MEGLLFLSKDTSATRTTGAPWGRAEALQAWRDQRAALPPLLSGKEQSREQQLVIERVADQFDRERAEIDRWALAHPDAATEYGDEVLVLVAHRHEWMCARLAGALTVQGDFTIVGAVDDMTSAIAALITTQPHVLVTSDRLLGGRGLELVERAAQLSPATWIVVQVEHEDRLQEACDAGADAVVSQRAPLQSLLAAVGHARQDQR